MAAFSPHAGIELESIGPSKRVEHLKAPSSAKISATRRSASVQRSGSKTSNKSTPSEPQPPVQSPAPLQVQPAWNEPKINTIRIPLLFFDFLVFGMNDGSYGAVLGAIEAYYNLSYTVVSLIFLTPFVGYGLAALLSSPLHIWGGQRSIAFLAPLCRLITYVVLVTHPPYPVLLVFLTISGVGNGLADAAWNAYIGDMRSTNEVLGLLHAFYGLGATIAPLIITSMLEKYGLPWWTFYYLMVALTVVDCVAGTAAFWAESGKEFRRKNSGGEGDEKGRTRQSLRNKVTWICAAFLFFYVGTEVSLGGWIITFMTQVRHGGAYESGFAAVGFWLGITLGRVVLGFVTPKIGERIAVTAYLLIAIALQLVFWLVPNFILSAVTVSLQGFFMGPLFPASVVAASKLLPKKLHVSAIGISSAIGGAGAAVLPFVTGAIANSKGVSTLQPIVLAFLVMSIGFWLLLPRFPKNNHDD